jgi:hypothetical protein
MTEQQLAQSRKRQRIHQRLPASKKQKLSVTSAPHSEDEFWNGLSKIWLTKYALRELDRRNAKTVSYSPSQRTHRPVTRNLLAEAKNRYKHIESVGDLLHDYSPETRKRVKLFARYGGPDLSDIRGVRIMKHFMPRILVRKLTCLVVSRACICT